MNIHCESDSVPQEKKKKKETCLLRKVAVTVVSSEEGWDERGAGKAELEKGVCVWILVRLEGSEVLRCGLNNVCPEI